MNIETVIQFVPVAVAAFTIRKGLVELLQGSRRGMEQDYKFAKEFLKDIFEDKPLHPYLREKGYRALAGSDQVSAAEVEYLLTMAPPDKALRNYSLGRSYLEHFSTARDAQIGFKPKYQSQSARTLRKWWYFALYMAAFILGFSPLITWNTRFLADKDPWTLTALTCVMCLPIAYMSLREGVRIGRAEALVASQRKAPGPILKLTGRN